MIASCFIQVMRVVLDVVEGFVVPDDTVDVVELDVAPDVGDQVPEVAELNWMLAKGIKVCCLDLAIVVIH